MAYFSLFFKVVECFQEGVSVGGEDIVNLFNDGLSNDTRVGGNESTVISMVTKVSVSCEFEQISSFFCMFNGVGRTVTPS